MWLSPEHLGNTQQVVGQPVQIVQHVLGGQLQGEAEYARPPTMRKEKLSANTFICGTARLSTAKTSVMTNETAMTRRGDLQGDDEDFAGMLDDGLKERGAQMRRRHGEHR